MKKLLLVILAVLCSSAVWGATNSLEFRHLVYTHYSAHPGDLYVMHISTGKDGKEVFAFTDMKGRPVKQATVLKKSRLILTAADIKPTATVRRNPNGSNPFIALEFTGSGKTKFADFTRRHVGEVLAIMVNGKIISAPTIREPILGGQVVINGNLAEGEAQRLADQINSAATTAAKGKH